MTSEISRVSRTHSQARYTYDQISRWYDWLEGNWERRARAAGLKQLGAVPSETILEIGLGPGHSLTALARSVGASGLVCGIDLSPGMLRVARHRLQRLVFPLQPGLCCADAVRIPFGDGDFDGALMTFVLELFDTPEIPIVLRECRRVLRAGGRVSVVSLSKAGARSRIRDLYEWGHRRYPQLLDCRPIFVQRSLEDAGFRICRASPLSLWGLPAEAVTADKPLD